MSDIWNTDAQKPEFAKLTRIIFLKNHFIFNKKKIYMINFFLYCFAAKAEKLRRLRKVFPFQKASQLSGLPVICQRINPSLT